MRPVEARGKLRIGFVAKCEIKQGVELFWNYGFDRRNGELPQWYANPQQSQPEVTPLIHAPTALEESHPADLQPPGRKEVTCMVPGCGQRVKKIWNHLHQTKRHSNLTGGYACMHTCMLIEPSFAYFNHR